MRNKVKLFLLVICAVFVPLFFIHGAIATDTGLSIESLGLAIVDALWIVFTIIAIIAFLIAGILFLTAFGDTEKIGKARSAFIWGIVGIVVGLLAFTIVSLMRKVIGA